MGASRVYYYYNYRMWCLVELFVFLAFLQAPHFAWVSGHQQQQQKNDDDDALAAAAQVLELTDTGLEAALNRYDYLLVDFYAPWCQHCKTLAPELDVAAPLLADDSKPIIVAKINADKYRNVAEKYDISFFPTMKLFTNGYPTDQYQGPHHAHALVSYARRLTAPAIQVFQSESALHKFIKSMVSSSELPLFVGFELEVSNLERFAHKFRSKAWFAAVMGEYSEKAMADFSFSKIPALVVLHGQQYEEIQDVFYGPFQGHDFEDFVKQNLLMLVTPLNADNLNIFKEDGRPNVVAVLENDITPKSKALIEKMKAAAPSNRAFVFSYVVASEWPKFVRPFKLGKKPKLPTIVIWDDNYYSKSSNAEAFTGDIVESELSKLLQDFKDKRLKQEKLQAPSFYEKAMENNASFLQFVGMLVVMSITIWTKNRAKRRSQVNTNPEENNPIAQPDGEDAGADKED